MGAGGLPNIIGATNPPPNPRKIGNKLMTDRRSNNDKWRKAKPQIVEINHAPYQLLGQG